MDNADITIELIADGTVVADTLVSGNWNVPYSFENVAAGTYTMKVNKRNHISREYQVVVGEEDVTLDVKISLIGDINGDRHVNVGDVIRAYAHAKKMVTLTDYEFACGNVTNDDRVDVADVAKIYAHLKKTSFLW